MIVVGLLVLLAVGGMGIAGITTQRPYPFLKVRRNHAGRRGWHH